MRTYYIKFLFFFCYHISFSQHNSLREDIVKSTYYANTLSVHPFGVFISRINNNFQLKSDKKISITTNLSSGNVWLPYVKAYNPLNKADRDEMRQIEWYNRIHAYNISQPSETTELHADGIIRNYQVKLNIPIANKHEIKINHRMFSLGVGRPPYSLLISDQFIEWFHSNIAGGEDPFARKDYGFNHASIDYKDVNDKRLQLRKGEFIFSGIDLSYYYYPNFLFLKRRNIYTNIGLQTGINLNKTNPSLDLGANFTAIKRMVLKNHKKEIRIGSSLGLLRQKLIRFSEGVELSNNNYLYHIEFLLEYVKHINENSYFSVASTWIGQSAFNKRSDYEHLVLTGERIESHWHYAFSHLYRMTSANNLAITYTKGNISCWGYLRQDFKVDNAPDFQTGIGLRFQIATNRNNK